MNGIFHLIGKLIQIVNSLFGNTWAFLLSIFTVVASFIWDLPTKLLDLFTYLGNSAYNSALNFLAGKFSSLGIYEYTYSIFDTTSTILTWGNYFLPIKECIAFAIFLLGFTIAFFAIIYFIKWVYNIVPTGG